MQKRKLKLSTGCQTKISHRKATPITKFINRLGVRVLQTKIENEKDLALYVPEYDVIYYDIDKIKKHNISLNMILLHELVHATGHHSRLNRLKYNEHNTFDVKREEVVAQYGAYLLGKQLNLLTKEDVSHTINYLQVYSTSGTTKLVKHSEMKEANKAIALLLSLV